LTCLADPVEHDRVVAESNGFSRHIKSNAIADQSIEVAGALGDAMTWSTEGHHLVSNAFVLCTWADHQCGIAERIA
jgi:hypothetical protein